MFLGLECDCLCAYASSLLLIPDTDADIGTERSEQSNAFKEATTEECVVPLSSGHCLLLLLLLLSLLLIDLCSLLRSAMELSLPVLEVDVYLGVERERAGLSSQN